MPAPDTPASPAIRPWRDALLAGIAVATAISLGAYIVYARAWSEKVADVRHHVAELAERLSRLASRPHETIRKLPKTERAAALASLSAPLSYVRDNSDEARRIYTFSLDDGEELTLLDSGTDPEKPAMRPLPDEARNAIAHFRKEGIRAFETPWTTGTGLESTSFSRLDSSSPGLIAIESDSEKLRVKISTVRQALWFTCLLGLGMGGLAGFFVWHMRSKAALVLAQIEESRRLEEATVNSLGEVIYSFDTSSKTFRWRGNVAELLGFRPGAETGRQSAWLARIHDDDLDRYLAAQDSALNDSRPMQIEYRVSRGDGTSVWVLDRCHPVQLSDGRTHLVGSLIDLTTRRAAEETLRLFFDETATAHVVFDDDLIIDANPAALALFAAEGKESLVSQPVWRLWPRRQPSHALSAEAWATHVLAAMEASVIQFEWLFARLDGSLVDCDVFLRQTTLRNRTVLLMACHDISPAKLAQAQLIESEQRFRDVSEAAGEFIWEMGHEGRYVYASRRVMEVLGYDPEEMLGRSPFEFVPEHEREAVKKRSEEIQAAGLAFRNFEHRVKRVDGAVRWISVSGVPIHDPAGRVTGYRGASLDITKHRDYEHELVLQKEAAEAADRAKSSFLAMMSHEIRTPLNSVLGFADLVLDTELTSRQREYLQTIKGSGDSLLALLNDILDFSKIESGRMEVEIRPADLPRCIREVMELHRLAAAARGLELTVNIAPDVPRHVLTDSSRLRQVLVNLLGNAVKFTPAGHIHLSASVLHRDDTSPLIRITVSDTGIGITPEQRERLFMPFTQADSSTTRRFGGTGLGLAISRRLASLLGGDLGLLDGGGPGSTFHLDLPARIPSAEELENLSQEPEMELFSLTPEEHYEGRAPLVLVVDDNTLNRRLTTHLLQQIGAETKVAASAAEAFARLEHEDFDLVLMDVQMPVMDGLDATRHIRAKGGNWGSLPIVALTADAMVGDRERCLEAGMDDYLTKPLRREDLVRILRAFAPANGR